MRTAEELLLNYRHSADEFPVFAEQTHKVLCNGRIVNKRININENIIHYLTETARLISVIDGRLNSGIPYDHIVYLDKSARPVSWLVNMFWDEFALKDENGVPFKRPKHSYINIDRAPWFRNVGINVNDDGRQKEDGELATYGDFVNNINNLSQRHLAEIRALYIPGGIEEESIEWVMSHPTILDTKNVLIVDEVSRTGATLDIAKHRFRLAIPDAENISGVYFWHPGEPLLKLGEEVVLTSLPVWYDPTTLTGRGIGSPDPYYYRKLYENYMVQGDGNKSIDIQKLRTHAFSSSVFSAPLLDESGEFIGLSSEGKTRMLCNDFRHIYEEYKAGHVFFNPPIEWRNFKDFIPIIEKQGVLLLPWEASEEEKERVRKSPLFYLNFLSKLNNS